MNRLLIILMFIIPTILFGQERAFPLNISFFNESTAIPYTRIFTLPIHPGIQIGTEFNYKTREHSRVFQTANICYFYHNHLAKGFGLNTEFGYEYRLRSGFAFSGLLGLGYMHTFKTAEEFTLTNGKYEKKADKGNARLYPSLSIEIGFYLKKTEKNSPKIFINYQAWAEYPYSPDFITIMTHINLHIGAKFFINPKTEKND